MPVVDHVVPNVQVLVQKLLKTLYNNVLNHKVSDCDCILIAQKMKSSVTDFFSKCDQNVLPRFFIKLIIISQGGVL